VSTPPDKPAARVSWKTIERVAAEAEASRLEAMSERQLDEELRKAGFEEGDADRVAGRALGRSRRPRWMLALVAAAVVIAMVLVWKRREVVAFFTGTPEPIGPDRWNVPPEPSVPAEPTREEPGPLPDAAPHEKKPLP